MDGMGRFSRMVGIVVGVAFGTAACGEMRTGDTQWAGTRDTIAGTAVVRNPAEPMFASAPTDPDPEEGTRVSVSERWRAVDTGPEELWADPAAVAVGGGRVFVLDGQANRVYALDAETGADLGVIGREGEGPAELQRSFGVGVIEGRLLVGDIGVPGLEIFGLDGVHQGSYRMPFNPFGFDALSDGHVMLRGLAGGGEALRIADLDGDLETVPTPFEPPDSSVVDPEIVFGDCPRWGAGTSGVLRAFCRRFAFQQLTTDGELVREVHVDLPPVLATEEELDDYEERTRRMIVRSNMPAAEADAFVKSRLEIARVKPVYNFIRADQTTGHIFMVEQNAVIFGGGGPAKLHVLDADGRYLAWLEFEWPWVDFQVDDGMLYALSRDPGTGLVHLAAYELIIPPTT